MSAPKRLLVNAFNMNCVGHIHHGLWTHPRDRADSYNTLDYWVDLARILERLSDGSQATAPLTECRLEGAGDSPQAS